MGFKFMYSDLATLVFIAIAIVSVFYVIYKPTKEDD